MGKNCNLRTKLMVNQKIVRCTYNTLNYCCSAINYVIIKIIHKQISYNIWISAQYPMMDTGESMIKLTLNYYETLWLHWYNFSRVSTYSELEAALFERFSLIVLDFSVDAVMLNGQRDAQMDVEPFQQPSENPLKIFYLRPSLLFHPFSLPPIKSSPRCDIVNALTTFFPRINAGDVDNQDIQAAISRELGIIKEYGTLYFMKIWFFPSFDGN